MNLTFDEQTILILYAEFYRKLYTPLEKEDELSIRHGEVQSLIYLIQQLVKSHQDYSFSWNGHGPYSAGLEILLRNLDKKEKLCTMFYKEYLPNCLFKNNPKMLEEYYPRILVEVIEQAIVVFDEILKDYDSDGCELLSSLLYFSKTVFPGWGFDVISKELQAITSKFDEPLIKKAWRCLGVLSLIDKDTICIRNISTIENKDIKKDTDVYRLSLKSK